MVPKPTEYIVDLVTTLSLPPDAMDVEMSSEQVWDSIFLNHNLHIENSYSFRENGGKETITNR